MIRTWLCLLSVLALLPSTIALAQLPSGWKAHDWERPRPAVVTPPGLEQPGAPPSDAIVLFDGTSLDAWRDADGNPCRWVIKEGVLESVPDSGYIYTAQAFGDVQLHVEWASPAKVEGRSQGRGNSGVFLMGLFEVQVLDSFENETYADGQASSLYGQYPPLVNASRRPGEWQTYDIVFHRPRFGTDQRLERPATLTVFHNGVLTQDHVEAWGPTSWLQFETPKPHPDKLPLSFQDHGNPVRYRNVWVRELDERPRPGPTTIYEPKVVQLNGEQLDRLVGTYDKFRVYRQDRHLIFEVFGRKLELAARSEKEFGLKYTAGKVVFLENDEGRITGLDFHLGGDIMHSERND